MSASPDHDGATLRGDGWSQAPCCRRGQSPARGHAPPPSSRACRREVSRLFDERSERLLCASDNADEQQRQPLLPPPKASPVALPRHLPMMVQTTQAKLAPGVVESTSDDDSSASPSAGDVCAPVDLVDGAIA